MIRKSPAASSIATQRLVLRAIGTVAFGVGPAWSVRAESLPEALAQALDSNPVLRGARADFLAVAAREDIARAAGQPSLSLAARSERSIGNRNAFSDPRLIRTGGLDVAVPIFQGGRVREAVRAAALRTEARAERLRGEEGDLILEVVRAYLDAMQRRRLVELRQGLVTVLRDELATTVSLKRHAEASRTDVQQARARLAGAEAQLALAEADGVAAQEAYRRVVGHLPASLEEPPPLPDLPAAPDEAVDIAIAYGPEMAEARATAQAADRAYAAARANRLPSLGFAGSVDYGNATGNVRGDHVDARIGLVLRVPLFQGGRVGAAARQAGALRQAAREDVIGTERAIVSQVRTSFSRMRAGRAMIAATDAARVADREAVKDVRIERKAGFRDTLDVLDAEQELFEAEAAHVAARTSTYAAGAAVLRAMGRAGDIAAPVKRAPGAEPARSAAAAPSERVDGVKILREGLAFDLRSLPKRAEAASRLRLEYETASLAVVAARRLDYDIGGLARPG
ncbi:TolC family outer membrane protein [Sphingomonas profundi]|uniref:TolC family outer membrane protein n=1 Tax=Alterirhizorhabdus profundi TaxID=2681549 RepID=UPI0012E72BCB|nr:TolC family outer membrane protein [Sphingomonas profundi]